MKRNPIKTFRNKCDKLWKEVCLKKNPRCESCGVKAVQSHHYIPKALSNALRYDIRNGISICMGCHLKHHTGDPQINKNFTRHKSEDWHKYIKSKRKEIVSPTLGWYKSNYERLKNEETHD